MKTSAAGRKAITEREGVRLKAYRDSVGILTIGVGHTSAAGTPAVSKGMTITAEQADAILSKDLGIFEKAVNEAVEVPLNQNEFDALVSFAFNVGTGAFQKSTLLMELNKGQRYGAANQFLRWDKAGGKVLKGLTKRREAERTQFLLKVSEKPAEPAPQSSTANYGGIAALVAAALAGAAAWLSSLPCSLFERFCQ